MSMLKCFFEIGSDIMLSNNIMLFDGLEISRKKELCEEYMGKFPVISVTLKSVSGRTFDEAKGMLRRIIGKEAMRFPFLMQSDRLTEVERDQYKALVSMDGWSVRSNAESGEGYSDISIEIRAKGIGIVIELKYAEDGAFDDGCREALRQIRDRKYEESLIKDGMRTIHRYGIACYRKQCRVVSESFVPKT